MTMFIDNRAGSKELVSVIPKGIPHELVRLPFGDVMWMGNGPDGAPRSIGVEYKQLNDLCNCITTGRLSGHQLIGLCNEYWRSYLLIEGIWRGNPQDGLLEVLRHGKWQPLTLGSRRFMAREITNYLNTLTIMTGIVVWQTGSGGESGEWLASTYRWWEKKWEDHHAHKQFNLREIDGPGVCKLIRPNLVHRVAAQLDGIGYDKGEILGRKFKTVMGLVCADEGELREVDGVGKVLAKKITNQLRGGGG